MVKFSDIDSDIVAVVATIGILFLAAVVAAGIQDKANEGFWLASWNCLIGDVMVTVAIGSVLVFPLVLFGGIRWLVEKLQERSDKDE